MDVGVNGIVEDLTSPNRGPLSDILMPRFGLDYCLTLITFTAEAAGKHIHTSCSCVASY
jgi:hypothetical protein